MAHPNSMRRWEALRRHAGPPGVTLALVAVNLISWFAVSWAYGLPPHRPHNSYLLLRVGALDGDLLRAGGWWRIIASQFLHVHFPHLLFNMAALLLLGSPLERAFGPLRFALLYLAGGSIGQLAGVLAAPALVSSGASQAVMGVAGARAVQLIRRRGAGRASLIILLAVTGIQLGLDLLVAQKIKAGHWVGLCAGALLGYLLGRTPGQAR
ncbi:MAG TPA: rhomboid family intramembrane serine protease [Pyrinomonadaceae bacterium]|nr:rhomboid family intramembrane serine protease [Pyrinomonadaceae bacterium]